MSRIGVKPISLPNGVEVNIDKNIITVKGSKGTLSREIVDHITVKKEENTVIVERENDAYKSFHGLMRSLIANMVIGVSEGFEKKLEINGVGYRAAKQGNKLVLTLGYSHPVEFLDNEDITTEVPDQATIIIKGIDKQKVGQFSSEVRAMRPPEPYKGKGIKYAGERIIRKEGKAGGKK